ncbi:MAG: tRNA (adenosine(37)-N6)-threonylcarbamoyltransferase complex dimerization subunit type 1 TsaB [Candidatus Onthomonas sp.]|nr:tRNA (adenosine(37)-N6)-threonylcarbamoyltransferase complex dimerization subunit type 1 TsaB [Candidatus Onthomonas sp.]
MKILALETSAKAASAAVTEEGRLVCSAYQSTGLTHSRTVMPMVEAMLKNADLTLADCGAVAVAAGPGSFTGIRIGVAAAKGLAFAAEKPVVGVSTLEAMARNVAWWDGLVICAMDARRHQVYNAVFEARDGVLTRLAPDRAIGLEELSDELQSSGLRKIIVGDGAELCYHHLSERGIACRLAPPHLVMQNAVSVGFAAEEAVRAGRLQTPQELVPVYLRISQAERERNERMKKELSK